MTGCKEIDDYIRFIRSGKYAAASYQIRLVDYIEGVFEKEQLYVDTAQLARYLNFEKYFPFSLFMWEKFVLALHDCTYIGTNAQTRRLRWPVLFLLVGRGAGKNGFVSFESFCMITPVNGVKNYNVDIFANAEDQAKTSFDDVKQMLDDHKKYFSKYFKWNSEQITNLATNSQLRFRTSGAKTKDGGRPGMVIFDEFHQYEDYKLVNVAMTGLGKKRFPRQTIITTDGDVRGGPLDDKKDIADGILLRGEPDNGFLPFICKLDNSDEVDDEENWYKANPSLQYFPDLLQEMRLEYKDFQKNPIANSSFLVKRMNLPQTFEMQSVADWEDIVQCNRPLPDLTGKPCIAGIDYAKTTDFVSAGLLFRSGEDGYYWIQHTWICTHCRDLPLIKAPLDEWSHHGDITWVDAVEISPDIPAEWLEKQTTKYDVRSLAIDNFRFTLLARALKEHGFDCDKGGANNIRLCKRVTQNRFAPLIMSLFNTHHLAWGADNALMCWYTYNSCIDEDKGNLYFAKKEPKARKTDGFFALVSAICASNDLPDIDEQDDAGDIVVMTF